MHAASSSSSVIQAGRSVAAAAPTPPPSYSPPSSSASPHSPPPKPSPSSASAARSAFASALLHQPNPHHHRSASVRRKKTHRATPRGPTHAAASASASAPPGGRGAGPCAPGSDLLRVLPAPHDPPGPRPGRLLRNLEPAPPLGHGADRRDRAGAPHTRSAARNTHREKHKGAARPTPSRRARALVPDPAALRVARPAREPVQNNPGRRRHVQRRRPRAVLGDVHEAVADRGLCAGEAAPLVAQYERGWAAEDRRVVDGEGPVVDLDAEEAGVLGEDVGADLEDIRGEGTGEGAVGEADEWFSSRCGWKAGVLRR